MRRREIRIRPSCKAAGVGGGWMLSAESDVRFVFSACLVVSFFFFLLYCSSTAIWFGTVTAASSVQLVVIRQQLAEVQLIAQSVPAWLFVALLWVQSRCRIYF